MHKKGGKVVSKNKKATEGGLMSNFKLSDIPILSFITCVINIFTYIYVV